MFDSLMRDEVTSPSTTPLSSKGGFMLWTDPAPPWPVVFARVYLRELARRDSSGPTGAFFTQILDLSGKGPIAERNVLGGLKNKEWEDYVKRQRDAYTREYLELLQGGSLDFAHALVTSPAMRAELGATSDAQLLACIAVTLYLKPEDPIGGPLFKVLQPELEKRSSRAASRCWTTPAPC